MMEDHLMESVIVPQKSQALRMSAQRRTTFRDMSQIALGGRSKVDPVAGKTLIDKKSQKMQVKQEQALWNLAPDPGQLQIDGGRERGLCGVVGYKRRKR